MASKLSKNTNIFVWVFQVLLAFWNIAGGVFLIYNYLDVAKVSALHLLPKLGWEALGVLEVIFALGLILPGIFRLSHRLTSISAGALALISLLGVMLFSAYDGFPGMLWGLLPALLAGYVAFKRMC